MFSGLNGYILHKRAYRETSYLVDAFTLEQGKVSFVAKGARSAKSPLKSLLQPFQPLLLSLIGQHQLKTLRDTETSIQRLALSGHFLYAGLYLNELLNRLLQVEYAHEPLFDIYHQTLQGLAGQQTLEPLLRHFEFSLLAELGYGLDFNQCAQSGQPVSHEHYYQWQPELGFVQVTQHTPPPGCFSGADLLAVAGQQWHPASLLCAKRISRLALQPLLGNKPLKSRELFIKGGGQ